MNTEKYFKHTEFDALANGFSEVPGESVDSGLPLFIRDGKKWIYTIKGLKKDLKVKTDAQLMALGYDVGMYWEIENKAREDLKPLSDLHAELRLSDTDAEPVYLEGGMVLCPDGTIRSR